MVAWIVALYGLEYALGIITFYQFILEEAIQGGCMACYIGKKYDKIGTMDPVIDRLENHTIPRLEDYNNTWGYIAIYNRGAFQAFIKASKLAVRAYKQCR